MAFQTPIMPFLRPLTLPKPSTLKHFLRFSTTSKCTAQTPPPRRQKEDHNLTASRFASPSYPPRTMQSLPRPKESRASRRTSLPQKSRAYPTRQPSHTNPTSAPKLIPEPITPLSEALSSPNLPYFVSRTRSNELPVYTDFKRGGNLKLTLVRRVDGDREVLRDQLRVGLGLEEKRVVVNGLTGQVVIKGHVKMEVVKFLRERRF